MRRFLLELKWELFKPFAHHRMALAFGALIAFELLMMAMLQHPAVQEELRRSFHRLGYTFTANFTGPTVAAFATVNTVTLLGNLFTALFAGEIVSKEVEDGTMRTLLCRPIGRGGLFAAKVTACLLFSVLVTIFVATSALAMGLLYQGPGHWLIVIPKESFVAHHEFVPGLARYAGATALMAVSTACVPILAFTFSCLNMKPATAAVLALATFVTDDTLRGMPFFGSVKAWFIMTYVTGWIHVYERRIPWDRLRFDHLVLFIFYGALLLIAWRAFNRRDLKP